jgi:hypothetical protein
MTPAAALGLILREQTHLASVPLEVKVSRYNPASFTSFGEENEMTITDTCPRNCKDRGKGYGRG